MRRIGYNGAMNEILFRIGELPVHTNEALIGFGTLALLWLMIIAIVIARSGRRGAELSMAQAALADDLEQRVSEMMRAQSEASGRVDAMGQALAGRQAELARTVNDRLDTVTRRVGTSYCAAACASSVTLFMPKAVISAADCGGITLSPSPMVKPSTLVWLLELPSAVRSL